MRFTQFLAISGGCFVLAALFGFVENWEAAWAVEIPGVIFLLIGAIGMIHYFLVGRGTPEKSGSKKHE